MEIGNQVPKVYAAMVSYPIMRLSTAYFIDDVIAIQP